MRLRACSVQIDRRLNEDIFYLGTDAYEDLVLQRIVEWKKMIEELGARSD